MDDLVGRDEDFALELPHQRRFSAAVGQNGTGERRRQVLVENRNLRDEEKEEGRCGGERGRI